MVIWLVVLVGCAKPPVKDLEETRRIITYLQESGAAQLAEVEYRAAEAALGRAEQFVKQGESRKAKQALVQARELSSTALKLSDQIKARLAEEQRLLTEKIAREAAEAEIKAKSAPPVLKEPIRVPVLQPEIKPAPVTVPERTPVAEPEPEPELVTHIVVVEEETLAAISARKEVYQDSFLWPLIYKANRDQIKDPQQIFPGQILLIPRDKTAEEIAAARQEAKDLNLF
jgi:nucleoid-associated protein YgaU